MKTTTEPQLLAAMFESAQSSATMQEFSERLLRGLRAFVGCDGALFRPGGRWPGSTAYSLDADHRLTDGYLRDADRYRPGMNRWCALSRGTVAIIDTEIYAPSERRRIALYSEVVSPCRIRSVMGCPLHFRGTLRGLVMLYRDGIARPFSESQAQAVTRILPGLALAEFAVTKALSTAPPALPARHAKLLEELLTGRSEKEIATALGLSPRTVHKYTEQIYRALKVRSRPELMAGFVRSAGG